MIGLGADSPIADAPVIVQVAPLLVGAEDAAKLLGLSRRTFERLLGTGRIPRPIRLGRRRLWRVAELQAWTDSDCPACERWEIMHGSTAR